MKRFIRMIAVLMAVLMVLIIISLMLNCGKPLKMITIMGIDWQWILIAIFSSIAVSN